MLVLEKLFIGSKALFWRLLLLLLSLWNKLDELFVGLTKLLGSCDSIESL